LPATGAPVRAKVELAGALGSALAAMHEATVPAPGSYDPVADAFVPVDDVRQWTLDRIDFLRLRCRDAQSLQADDERFIDGLIDSCSSALQEPFSAVVVHHDFSLANTNYEESGNAYRATGVFDLGEAHFGNGEEDLVRFLFRRRRVQRDALLHAYTDRKGSGCPLPLAYQCAEGAGRNTRTGRAAA
jgi:hygromycin-B 7''-O-kinase